MRHPHSCFMLIILCGSIYLCNCKLFTLHILFPWKGFWGVGSHSAGAATLALESVKANKSRFSKIHQGNHSFKLTWNDTQCTPRYGLPLLVDGYFKHVDAFIGPICSVICEPGGHLVTQWKIPMVSFGSTSSLMSNNKLYPTFARTSAPVEMAAPLFLLMMRYYTYKRVSVFTGFEPIWNTACSAIRSYLLAAGINVVHFSAFQRDSDSNKLKNLFSDLKRIKEYCKGEYFLGGGECGSHIDMFIRIIMTCLYAVWSAWVEFLLYGWVFTTKTHFCKKGVF